GDWVLWRVVPTRVEFWQGASDRNHTRIVYRRVDGRWQLAAPAPVSAPAPSSAAVPGSLVR
ncbi:pyridoxine 5'-phosphate oxidase C-terminal domain-containing protein, partial [Microbacterium paraoxydans]